MTLSRLFIIPLVVIITACTAPRNLSVPAGMADTTLQHLINDSALRMAHLGISLYDPESGKTLLDYQGDKYFVPASNTKIPTCYAAMKYLGDSLTGVLFEQNNEGVTVYPTGDPTFLHPDFKAHPVMQFLNRHQKVQLNNTAWQDEGWGSGWSWNDYEAAYMVERSSFPVYGNVIRFMLQDSVLKNIPEVPLALDSGLMRDSILLLGRGGRMGVQQFSIGRDIGRNFFTFKPARTAFRGATIPFHPSQDFLLELLNDTLHTLVAFTNRQQIDRTGSDLKRIYSQATDSMLTPMMHRSDNFFAEQALLMVSKEILGIISDDRVIDTLLKTDFKSLPQRPRWADGSGLSRYNLFTPRSFVSILEKMKNEFGMERIRTIFPTGNRGTLTNYYKADSAFVFAKTGTLSGVVALSGYMYTKSNRLLIFSVLVNNHTSSSVAVRRAVERFVQSVRNKY